MRMIESLILRVSLTDAVGRAPFGASELIAHNLDHPSRHQVKDILSRAPRFLLFAAISLFAFLYWNMVGFAFLCIAVVVSYLSPLLSALLEWSNFHKWNRPDLFIGWNFSSSVNEATLPAPPVGALLMECMKPAWGAVLVIPPAASSDFARIQAASGNRAVFLPCLQVTSGDWKDAVSWVLGQVRAAVFEVGEEGKASLNWEVELATRLLGAQRVLLVRREGERFIVSSEGRQLSLPQELSDLQPPISEAPNEEAIAKILGWCSAHLPVRCRDLVLSRLWFKVYRLEAAAIKFARLVTAVFAMTGLTLLVLSATQR